ncbi:MAG: hypothetical protein WBP72_03155 [Rhodocyclaceae bacterium]
MTRTRITLTRRHLPMLACGLLGIAALWHGPVAQLPNYHAFADQSELFGFPHGQDVLSNLGFALVALWGWLKLAPRRDQPALADGWAGYQVFLLGLFLTALGSAYYHLAPDNTRLVWDRLPIALACGGLLAGFWGDTRQRPSRKLAALLSLAAAGSVAWWYFTELAGRGDLRPYLLLQILPILFIPLWQWLYQSPVTDRRYFGAALAIYVIAKIAELADHEIAALLSVTTGHTIKHLLATIAAGLIVGVLVRRVRAEGPKSVVVRPVSDVLAALAVGQGVANTSSKPHSR